MTSINREANNNLSKCPSDHSDTGRTSGATLPASSAPIQQITCHITTADNHVYQIMVDQKSEASQVLQKICKKLGIMDESEYFGLQFFGKQNELIWLNLRNQLARQMSGSPPYSLFLKVKYFVQPQRLIQDETKRQFFLNIVEHFQKGEWICLDANLQLIGEMIALMTHTNYGSFNKTTTPCKYGCFWPESRGEIPHEALRIAANFHQKLNQQTNKNTQYEVMRRAHSSLNLYGSHFFECIHMYGYPMKIGVGPEKLFICNPDGTLTSLVTLRVLDDAGQAKERQYELKTKSLAQSMYRCITEIHAFFQSENIPAQVLEQTTNRNVLDSITSLFEHNHGGKEYAFDVMKTAQEVYDQALRNAYHWSQASTAHNREHFFTNVQQPTFNLLEEDSSPVKTTGIPGSLSPKLSNRDRGNSVTLSSEGSESSISDVSYSLFANHMMPLIA
ncbi:hypothetical protein Ciccas_003507 [Cichlidogyrus casuarinus]|uniref:FERM domain-containing protein n=1 Tax=Cichlidogyrus casuarinus TaxID=1844966 RepID=A0ABD2QE69_9PLAT